MKHDIERQELGQYYWQPAEWLKALAAFGGIETTELLILAYHDGVTPVWIDLGNKKPLKLVMRDFLHCCIVRASENQYSPRRREHGRSKKINVHWGE
jgi:hypothetical protein